MATLEIKIMEPKYWFKHSWGKETQRGNSLPFKNQCRNFLFKFLLVDFVPQAHLRMYL